MNTDDVRNYLTESPEGQALLEDLKKPLLPKRDELLSELTKANGKAGEVLLRSNESERLLNEERASVRKLVLVDQLDKLLKPTVPDLLRPSVTAAILAANESGIESNGLDRQGYIKVVGQDGKETKVDLQTFVDSWKQTDQAKQFVVAPPIPAGLNSRVKNQGGSLSLSAFNALTPEQRMTHARSGGIITE